MILAHGTNRPLLHIIIIHIIHIIFLFQWASTNLIAYFPLKPMGICFLHYWAGCLCFKSFVLLPICKLQPLVLLFQCTLMV